MQAKLKTSTVTIFHATDAGRQWARKERGIAISDGEVTRSNVVDLFLNGVYARVGDVTRHDNGISSLDKLTVAYQSTQNLEEPWQDGQRSSMVGDIFELDGATRYVVRAVGFEQI